ncbi:hypothetical protein LRS03_06405 [Rhizobacter sp. J219]|nr:hypothetical protein [Rhizobacter sp. J219]MCR5882513.1 hypothetical protein [Rhizobacter sp. J219]
MQTVSEVMTRNVEVIAPEESLQRAAQLMDEPTWAPCRCAAARSFWA